MKHICTTERTGVSLNGRTAFSRRSPPVLAQRSFRLNARDRMVVEVIERSGQPVLRFDRQAPDSEGRDWRSYRSLEVSVRHIGPIVQALDGILKELAATTVDEQDGYGE